jgi:Zn-dependent metalloprotease
MRKVSARQGLVCLGLVGAAAWAGCSSETATAPIHETSVDPGAVQRSIDHFEANARSFGLAHPASELAARRSRVDAQGTRHIRFDQLHQGIKVFEGEAIAHLAPSGAVTVTDGLRRDVAVDVQPQISAEQATAIARAASGVHGTVETPIRELVILPHGEHSPVDRLTWHVQIFSEDDENIGPVQADYFVDAHSGEIAWTFDSLETSAATGTGRTMYSGEQDVDTDHKNGTYYLRDRTRGGGNYTCDKGDTQLGLCNQITRKSDIFGDSALTNTDRATAGADAHYGMSVTWDYFQDVLDRDGIDDDGRRTYSRVHYGKSYANAFWSSSCFCMTYGDGDGMSFFPFVALDIAGHELSHGVTATSANLTYAGESGGLNESTSDIFGTMIEFYAANGVDTPDYLIGERIVVSNYSGGVYTDGSALRYMQHPSLDGKSPDCWSSSIGNLNVHYASGPNNHMFYLLAQGGRSACNGNWVNGIGRAKATQIWYKALTDYMTSSTGYAGARDACLSAAEDLYGAGSAEQNAVAAAYAAINVL